MAKALSEEEDEFNTKMNNLMVKNEREIESLKHVFDEKKAKIISDSEKVLKKQQELLKNTAYKKRRQRRNLNNTKIL